MKIIETDKDGVYSCQCEFTDEEIPIFIIELKKRPRLMKAFYDSLVESGMITPHGEF